MDQGLSGKRIDMEKHNSAKRDDLQGAMILLGMSRPVASQLNVTKGQDEAGMDDAG